MKFETRQLLAGTRKDLHNIQSRLAIGQANFPFTGLCVHFSVRKMYGLRQLAVKGLKAKYRNMAKFLMTALLPLAATSLQAVLNRNFVVKYKPKYLLSINNFYSILTTDKTIFRVLLNSLPFGTH